MHRTYAAYVELGTVYILEKDGDGVLPRLAVVYIAHPVGGQVGLPVLVLWDFEFAGPGSTVLLG